MKWKPASRSPGLTVVLATGGSYYLGDAMRDQRTAVGDRSNGRDQFTDHQLAVLHGEVPKRSAPFLLTLEGHPALTGLTVLVGIVLYLLFH